MCTDSNSVSCIGLVSYEFPSTTKAEEVLKVTIYYLSGCVREGKKCKGYIVTRKKNRKEARSNFI